MLNTDKIKQLSVIIKPIITEKSMSLIEKKNVFTFKVDRKASKTEIKHAIEKLFSVNVLKIRTINVKPKAKRVGRYEGYTQAYKKAMVELVPGQKIEAFNI